RWWYVRTRISGTCQGQGPVTVLCKQGPRGRRVCRSPETATEGRFMVPQAISPARIAVLTAREERAFEATHRRSRALHDRAHRSLLNGVPMNWMEKWPGPFRVFMDRAQGARLWDVDGNEYIDFCLGDTGAMAGHAPTPTVDVVSERMRTGTTAILPTP